jgi:hypothetical protein
MSGIESSAGEEDDDSLGDPQSLAHPTSIARLCPADSSKAKLNMVCTWSALVGGSRTDIVHSQHHFTSIVGQTHDKKQRVPNNYHMKASVQASP